MYVPEWEIEETIAWNPSLVEIPGKTENLKLIERQRYLKKLGRYIDILFKNKDKYVIVEVKCVNIEQPSIVTDQVLEYRRGLSKELRIPEEKIVCILATSEGFSKEVEDLCERKDVLTVEIDENEIINVIPKLEKENKFSFSSDYRKTLFKKILRARGIFIDAEEINNLSENIVDEIKSTRTWLKYGDHDEHARKRIANIFKEISERAPICAHEVGFDTNGALLNNYDVWFWLFYSVMDRRSNAANFIKARRALEERGLFKPQKIVELVDRLGEESAVAKIAGILEIYGFPLMYDSFLGRKAQPKSIVDAAKFISTYNYDFDELYDIHIKNNKGDYEKTYASIRKEVRQSIYGVGPRISSQFIRGMVLKGNWNLPLTDDLLLEKCSFNVRFAGKLRLGLISNEDDYYQELGQFADEYLNGNRAIISHVLWFTRKRYCDKKIKCNQCKLAGFCEHYQKTILEPVLNQDVTLEAFL